MRKYNIKREISFANGVIFGLHMAEDLLIENEIFFKSKALYFGLRRKLSGYRKSQEEHLDYYNNKLGEDK